MGKLSLSVVVPCYNEQESLAELYRRVTRVCRECVGDSYEFLLINDGSRDATWSRLTELAATDLHIVAVNLSRNFGHQLALSAGLSLCRGQRIFILDADLQDPPELCGPMMARMDTGLDVVYGQRIERDGETAFKKASAHLFYRLLEKLADISIPTDTGDFRLLSRRAVQVLNSMPEHHRFIRGMVSWMGLRQEAFAYRREARFAGTTKYPLTKMIRFAIDAITGFSIRPLRLATYLAVGFGAMTLAMMIYILMNYFFGYAVSGWTSMTLIILGIASVQSFIAGVMGEYVGRIYVEAKRRPLFVIQDVLASATLTTSFEVSPMTLPQ